MFLHLSVSHSSHSVHKGGVWQGGACVAGGMYGRRHAWQGACMAGRHAW